MTEEYRSEVLDLRGRNFAQVDNSVLKDGKILDKSSQKIVYVMLCMHADNTSKDSWPSVKRLAKECMISQNTVRSALKKLKQVGLIEIEERKVEGVGHISNRYILLPIPKEFDEGNT